MIKYRTTPDMELIRLSDNHTIHLAEIKLGNWGGQNTVLDIGTNGKSKTIRRSTIDESAFSLGPKATYGKTNGKAKTYAHRPATHYPPDPGPGQDLPEIPKPTAVVVRKEQSVSMSKEELVHIHQALQAAADATQKLLVRLIMSE
jgi:hypothetical protein